MKKTQISAQIIADSVNQEGDRLTTFIVTFPRIILAELNTHRVFSRNSASSRAIPFEKMMNKVSSDPFIPIKWQKDHKGMQGNDYLNDFDSKVADSKWLAARDSAVAHAKLLNKNIGVTKQFCNRLLEPFLWHTAIITSSEWKNFFALRAHGAAEIHIADLAYKMLEDYNNSEPNLLEPGQWHVPFGEKMDIHKILHLAGEELGSDPAYYGEEGDDFVEGLKIKIATARCARVSYLNYEGNDDYAADVKLHDRLSGMGHWSPFEHCAKAMTRDEYRSNIRGSVKLQQITRHSKAYESGDTPEAEGWSGNLKGFVQYRKIFEGENKTDERVIQKTK